MAAENPAKDFTFKIPEIFLNGWAVDTVNPWRVGFPAVLF
jgi:hypothetical protein